MRGVHSYVSLPKLPFIVKARFVSKKAEYVHIVVYMHGSYADFEHLRAKIKDAGGAVKLIA